ncbi:MAG: GTPase ObgE [Elusimicrobia bacterium]|nr:GTPase ObgE [Elusimicrobiota bacterium]
MSTEKKPSFTDFTDIARIYLKAGKGGDGCMSFRREKYVPFGGPDGGNGGKGGDIYIESSSNITTLTEIALHPHITAENGEHGKGKNLYGKAGKDTLIYAPAGTIIKKNDQILADLQKSGERFLAAKGGRGGKGNAAFKTRFNTAPRISEKGEPGEEFTLMLELNLLADVGLVGFPNAGKSTLLSIISSARPKIADYPFTTLKPNLGVVRHKGQSFVAADIPGLIEGAHEGKGLGDLFLRHLMRTRLLVQVIDPEGFKNTNPVSSIRIIRKELKKFSPELAGRPIITALNKSDLPSAGKVFPEITKKFKNDRIFLISAATGEGINKLLDRIITVLPKTKMPQIYAPSPPEQPPHFVNPVRNPPCPKGTAAAPPMAGLISNGVKKIGGGFKILRAGENNFEVRGESLKKLMAMTNFSQPESVERLKGIFKKIGLDKALRRSGVSAGAIVTIEGKEFDWEDDVSNSSCRH